MNINGNSSNIMVFILNRVLLYCSFSMYPFDLDNSCVYFRVCDLHQTGVQRVRRVYCQVSSASGHLQGEFSP